MDKSIKKTAMIWGAICLSMTWFGQGRAQEGKEDAVSWPLSSVTVYESGAKVERSGAVRLNNQGMKTVRIGGLAEHVDEAMLQLNLDEGWSLVSHVFAVTTIPAQKVEAEKEQGLIKDEISRNRQTHSLRDALKVAYEEELAMIRANRSVSGGELLLVEDLREHADFWRERVKELQYKMLELRMEMETLDENLAALEQRHADWQAKANEREGQLTLRFAGPPNGVSTIRMSYVVAKALWRAVYDAEVDENGAISMRRFALVEQNTGNDWVDVPLTFLVGNPLESIAPPVPVQKRLTLTRSASTDTYSWEQSEQMDDFEDVEAKAMNAQAFAGPLERYSFIPANSVDILGNGTRERVYIEDIQLEGDLSHLLLPAYADESYQLVNSGEWPASNLLPGPVQVLTDGVYRGSYFMRLPAPGDTLQIPLGQDSRVRSTRQRLLDQCSSSVLGGTRKTAQMFEIRLENQHNRSIIVRVEDGFPVSNSSDIQVEPLSLGGGDWDRNTGSLTWDLTLAAGETRTLMFGFEVTYPKKRALQGL